MFKINLFGGNGSKKAVAVTDAQELVVIGAPHPPLVPQKVRPFRQYLTADGLADGNHDMGVDGSVTAVDYHIPAIVDDDRYITTLSFVVGYDVTGSPYNWADGAPLPNGCRLFYSSLQGEVDIHDAIKSNEDMFRLSFNQVDANWQVRHVLANNDYGYFITMDLTKLGLPFGIKLDRGTSQRLVMRIRDNVGVDANKFDCIAYGFDRFR